MNLVVTNPDYSYVMAFDLKENKLINKLSFDSAYYNYVDISVVDDRLCIRYGDEMNSYNKDLSELDPVFLQISVIVV